MPLLPETLIDEIQTRSDIAEVIGRYVPLKRAGRHFKANCPFHKERTPSFMVNTDKQIFHCFGCGVGGNVFSFLMQHDRLTFPEAARQLADHVGVRLPEHGSSSSDDDMRKRLAGLMETACRYFERTLSEPSAGKAARSYLARRGVSERTRRAFRLGLAPAGWDRLLSAAKAKGVAAEPLEAAGLVIKGRSGFYDRFRDRLMFPILDVRGRIVGFGGRSLEKQEPKYLNSPETPLYTKGRHLFGLSQAKDAILKAKTAIVVEGYFDCVVLADGGITHVVSPLGTALTIEQAKLLKRYAERVILAFDADAAGEQATLRGIDLLVEAGLDVRVAQLPTGKDPDECLRSMGCERFEQLLDRSVTIFEMLVETARRRYPVTAIEGKVQAARFVLPTIANMQDSMLRSEYVKRLAEQLRLDEAAVAAELAKIQPRSSHDAPRPGGRAARPSQASKGASIVRGSERLLTALVLDEPSRWRQVQGRLTLDDVTDPTLQAILRVVVELELAGGHPTPAQVVSRTDELESGALIASLVELTQSIASPDEALEDCLRRIQAQAHGRQLAELRDRLRSAQATGQDEAVRRLLTEYQRNLSMPAAV